MSWFDRIRTYPWSKSPDQILAAGPAAAGVIAVGNVGKPTWPSHDIGTYEREGYIALALIFSCVNLIADAASAVPLRVFDERPDGSTPTIPRHGMANLMRRPNPEQSQADFIWSVVATAAIAGFCVIEKVRSAGGRVVELWPLDPTRCRAVPRNQAPPDWQYSVPGQRDPIALKAEDVIVRRWRKRMSRSPYGIGPLEALLREVGLANCMTDFLKAFFDGGAIAQQAIILQTRPGAQKLPQAEKDAFVEEWTRANAGLRNAARPLFFGGIKEIVDIGFDFNELAWVGLRDLNDLAICQAFGVPASMAQIRAGLEHSDSRANAEVDKAKLYENTVIPQLTGFDGDLTLGLLTDFEPDPSSLVSIEFDTSNIKALQENRNERATALTPAFLGGGIPASVFCKETGLEPPDVDFYIRPISIDVIPADDPIPAPKPVIVPAPVPPVDPSKLTAAEVLAIASRIGPTDRFAKAANLNRALVHRIAVAREPSLATFLDEQLARLLAALNAPVGLVATIGSNGHGREMLAIGDFDWPAEDTKLQPLFRSLHNLAGATASKAASDTLGIAVDWDLENRNVRNVLDRLALRVVDVNDRTRRDIANVVTQAQIDGVTLDEMAGRLKGLYQETYRGRSMTIARTESMVSYGEASVLGYRSTGVVDRVKVLDNPNHTDDYGASDGLTCATRDGIVVALDSGMDHIYADHPNGSATLAPVLVGEVLP